MLNKMPTKQEIQKKGSPLYVYANSGTITTTSGWIKSFNDNDAEKEYLPFTELRIINNSTANDIYFYVNQNSLRVRRIKSGSDIVLSNCRVDRWKVLAVTNTLGANEVVVEAEVSPITQDEKIREDIGNPLSKLKDVIPIGLAFIR